MSNKKHKKNRSDEQQDATTTREITGDTEVTTEETQNQVPEENKESLLAQELENLKDTHLRLRAEYENFRKRTLREKSDLIKYAGEKAISAFLEVVDDFDRALSNIPETEENKELRDGVELIRLKMLSKLKSQGVNEMEVIGKDFDAEEHEAVAMVPTDEQDKKGKVIDCVQKGYTLNDKIIRHPKVVVGQ